MKDDFLAKLKDEIASNHKITGHLKLFKKFFKEGKISTESVRDIFTCFENATGKNWTIFLLKIYASLFSNNCKKSNVVIHEIMCYVRSYFTNYLKDMSIFDLLGSNVIESGISFVKIEEFISASESGYSTDEQRQAKDNVDFRINLYLAIAGKCREYSYDLYMKNSHKIERYFVEHYVDWSKCKVNICENIVKIVDKKSFCGSLSAFVYLYNGVDKEIFWLNNKISKLEEKNLKLTNENIRLTEQITNDKIKIKELIEEKKQLSGMISKLNGELLAEKENSEVVRRQCDAKCEGFIKNTVLSLRKNVGLELECLREIAGTLGTSDRDIMQKLISNIEGHIDNL